MLDRPLNQLVIDEKEVRRLRDQVYSVPTSNHNWEYCRAHWMRPDSIKWLREKSLIKI